MATIEKTIDIIFGAVDNTGSVIQDISSGLSSAAEGVSTITGPLSDVAEKAETAQAAIVAMGAALLTVAVNEAAQFGEKIEEIGSLVNAAPEDVDKLTASVQEFAQNSTTGFDGITSALYTATSNIGDTEEALNLLAVAEQGAIVGATDLETTAALLTRTMNAYGLVTEDSATNTANAERIMATMFATVQNGDTNMAALSENLGQVSSTAAAAGVPIETLGAAIAAITAAGVNTPQTMTLLNSVIKELLSPSEELTTALNGLSITTDGLPAIMDQLKTATGGSADKIYELFSSSEAAKGALILANDSAGKFKSTLEAADSSISNFNKNVEAMSGGVEDSAQKLENSLLVSLQKLGNPLQETWAGVLDSLAQVSQGFSISIDEGAFDDVFAALNAFGGDVADSLQQIGANLPEALAQVDFSGLLDSLSEVGIEIGGLFGDLDLSTPEGLADAIQFVVDSLESLNQVISGIIEAWQPLVQGFISGVDAFNDLDSEAKKTFGNFAGYAQVFETLKGAVLGGADALETIGTALQAIAGIEVASKIAQLTGALGSASGGLAAAATVAAGAVGYTAGTGLAQGIDLLLSKVTGSETSLGSFIYDLTHAGEEAATASTQLTKINQSLDQTSQAADGSGEAVRDFDAEVQAAVDSTFDWASSVEGVAESLNLTDAGARKAADGFATLAEAEQYIADNAREGAAQFVEYRDGLYYITDGGFAAAESLTELADSSEEAAKSAVQGSAEWERVQNVLIETQKVANDFSVEMGKLANERYAIDVQADVDLKTAQIEADTARIQSAFQAIGESVTALTTGTSDLWGTYADKAGFVGGEELEQAALRMEERLDRELALKEELTAAVVAQAEATTERLLSNEPIIQIDGGSLSPELEMIFDKILNYTQIRASNEGLNLLLGV